MKMTILSGIRRLAFLVILAGALAPATVRGDDDGPNCPAQRCESCPAEWSGSCYAGLSESCSSFGCTTNNSQMCTGSGGATYTFCYCDPCEA